MRHVDVVRNAWREGVQERLCAVEHGDLGLRWRPVLADPKRVAQIAREIGGDTLDDVTARLNGSYVFATEPHEVDDCPFLAAPRLPFVPIPPPAPTTQEPDR